MLYLFDIPLPDFWTSAYPGIVEALKSFLLALLTLFIGWTITGWVTRLVDKAMTARGTDKTLRPFLRSTVNVGMKIFVLLTAASTLGIQTTSFATALGAAFLAIGIALQGTLSNLAGGALILMFRPFKVGDVINAQNFTGVVKEIQIFTTILITPDNQTIIVPNGALSNGAIRNLSLAEIRRIDMTFTLKTREGLDTVKSKIYEILRSFPTILDPERSDVFILATAAESVDITVRPWVKTPDYWDTYLGVSDKMREEFSKLNILITYTALDATTHLDLERIG